MRKRWIYLCTALILLAGACMTGAVTSGAGRSGGPGGGMQSDCQACGSDHTGEAGVLGRYAERPYCAGSVQGGRRREGGRIRHLYLCSGARIQPGHIGLLRPAGADGRGLGRSGAESGRDRAAGWESAGDRGGVGDGDQL